jgi:hypothetical protein
LLQIKICRHLEGLAGVSTFVIDLFLDKQLYNDFVEAITMMIANRFSLLFLVLFICGNARMPITVD